MFANLHRPNPIDQEVEWDKSKTIVSSTDAAGTITYANDTFAEVSGYPKGFLIGKPQNLIRHPDMPQIIFKVLWDNLNAGRNFHAIVKNLAFSGKYYWVITDFVIEQDAEGKTTKITANRHAVPQDVVDEHIAPLYATLLKLEKLGGMELSNRYLKGYLTKYNTTYVEYIMSVMAESKEYLDKKLAHKELQETDNQEVNTNINISDEIYNEANVDQKQLKSFFSQLFQN